MCEMPAFGAKSLLSWALQESQSSMQVDWEPVTFFTAMVDSRVSPAQGELHSLPYIY